MPGDYGSLAAIRRDIKTNERLRDDAIERLDGLQKAAAALEGLPTPRTRRRRAKVAPPTRGRKRR